MKNKKQSLTADVRDKQQRLLAQLSRERRAKGSTSAAAFARIYLPHHFALPPSRMHDELFGLLDEASTKRGARVAVAAPRGHAKSTVVSLAYVLWGALVEHEPFTLIVSATRDQAAALLRAIREELQSNVRLLADFPEACAPPGGRPSPKPWRDVMLALPNGSLIRVAGANQGIRGLKHKQHRPSLIVVDDLEDQEHVASAEQRTKTRDWFERTLLKCGDERTNVIVVGTVLHYDALLARLTGIATTRSPGWVGRVYKAVEQFSDRQDLWDQWEALYGGAAEHQGMTGPDAAKAFLRANEATMLSGVQVLWPDREPYEALMVMKVVEGRGAFQAEKQNEPIDPKECFFSEDSIHFWDDPRDPEHRDVDALLAALGSSAEVFTACDPSLGTRSAGADSSAIVTVVKDRPRKRLFVIGAEIAIRKPDAIVMRLVELASLRRHRAIVVESNSFQELLAQRLEGLLARCPHYTRVIRVKSQTNKIARIQSLEPLVAQGVVKFSRRHTTLLDQLRQFPLGAHDDGPDALQMAVSEAMRYQGEVCMIKIKGF